MERTVTLQELHGRTVQDLVQEVARRRESLRIRLDDGDTVIFVVPSSQNRPQDAAIVLEPLPLLQGFVPEGWKEAVYDIGGF